MRIVSFRSVCATTRTRPAEDAPSVRKRDSSRECVSSGNVVESGSSSTVAASWNVTRCFLAFAAAFCRVPFEHHRENIRPAAEPPSDCRTDKLFSGERPREAAHNRESSPQLGRVEVNRSPVRAAHAEMGHKLRQLYLKPRAEGRDFPSPAGGWPAGDTRRSRSNGDGCRVRWANEAPGGHSGSTPRWWRRIGTCGGWHTEGKLRGCPRLRPAPSQVRGREVARLEAAYDLRPTSGWTYATARTPKAMKETTSACRGYCDTRRRESGPGSWQCAQVA
jgi:hypothetical protein